MVFRYSRLWLFLGAFILTAVAAYCNPAEAPETSTCDVSYDAGALTVKVGDYEVYFSKQASWTYKHMTYQGSAWLQPSGHSQSVMSERLPAGIKVDGFLGTGHRAEAVDEVSVIIKEPGKPAFSTVLEDNAPAFRRSGPAVSVSVVKQSRFV